MWRQGNARGVVRQVLELLLLWPQGKEGAGREGWGRDDVIQGGLVVRKKNGNRKTIDRKQAEERTKGKVRVVECLRWRR